MYSVYFNNILQKKEDINNINDVMQTSIVREDGFDSTNQILREKSDVTLSFTGDSYKYVCGLLKENPCVVIDVLISDECGYRFEGTMSITGLTNDINKCTFKTPLKDTSFSAYIDGYLSTDVPLYDTKTKNCEPILTIQKNFIVTDETNANFFQILAFDVLDVFKYMINYYTDNRFEVKSDFLTNNKYAITTGFNMHNHGSKITDIYPVLQFEELFKEIRKKLRIYMGVEYDVYGKAYLRIEDEPYFFEDSLLFTIDLPKDAVQTFDIKRNFNQIDIGSDITEVQDGSPVTYPQNRYTAWNKESFTGCGTCTGEKDSKLDLVSTFIIDSNILIEAVKVLSTDDYDHDDSIFLFNYEVAPSGSNTVNKAVMTLDVATTKYYYNETLINENVLANWIEYFNKCIEIQRNSKYGFLANRIDYGIRTPGQIGYNCGDDAAVMTEIYDNLDSVHVTTYSGGDPDTPFSVCPPRPDNFTYFLVTEVGDYNFKTAIQNMRQTGTDAGGGIVFPGIHGMNVDYFLHILVYDSIALGTQLFDIEETANAADGVDDPVNLLVESGNITLAIGNVVLVYTHITINGFRDPTSDYIYTADNLSFELLNDSFACETIDYNDQNSKPYQLDFSDAICWDKYDITNKNKKGYFMVVAGSRSYKQWVKEWTFINDKISRVKTIGNDIICGC